MLFENKIFVCGTEASHKTACNMDSKTRGSIGQYAHIYVMNENIPISNTLISNIPISNISNCDYLLNN